MNKSCDISGKIFDISSSDFEFYKRVDVPPPTLCPEERARRRMSFANQRNLYHRKCAGTGKNIISNYSPEKDVPVLDIEFFYSDEWDPLATGRDFDFSRPFFEQFSELLQVAPRPNLQRAPQYDENSDYTNYAGKNQNCYLVFDSDKNRDCYYSYSINSCENVVDCFRAEKCELCYQCTDCTRCYSSTYLQNCDNCVDSTFLKNSIGCKNCFGCINLRNKQYCFLNEQLTAEEYFSKLCKLELHRRTRLHAFSAQFAEFTKQFAHKFMEGVQNENVTGNYLTFCKNAEICFDSRKLWDCKYVISAFDDAKNCMDCTQVGDEVELFYESCYAGYGGYYNRFVSHCLGKSSYLTYCYFLPHCSNCFGCVGLRHVSHCILNKQYSKSDYEKLVLQIVAHMKSTKEWGEFFPITLSPFAYNETTAYEYYPLDKEDALARGWGWKDDIISLGEEHHEFVLPDSISDTHEDIVSKILRCKSCSKNYRLVKQELAFYKQLNLPVPELCINCRYTQHLVSRNPRRLFERKCNGCDTKIHSSFAPERSEKIYCEQCYLKEVD